MVEHDRITKASLMSIIRPDGKLDKQPDLYLFSSTLKNDIVTTTHHENKILEGG